MDYISNIPRVDTIQNQLHGGHWKGSKFTYPLSQWNSENDFIYL